VLKPHLQEKFEYVIKVRLSELQIKLYSQYLENCAKQREDQEVKKGTCLFADYQNLLRVWNHPYALLIRAQQDEDNV
jgi:transcriptional regulator ATRX